MVSDISLESFLAHCDVCYDDIEFFYCNSFNPSISYDWLVEHCDLTRCYLRYFNKDQFDCLYVVFESYVYNDAYFYGE